MASDYPIHLKEFSGTILFDACDVEAIQKMEIREDDTWVLSFPRSGNFTIQRYSNAQPKVLSKQHLSHVVQYAIYQQQNCTVRTGLICAI